MRLILCTNGTHFWIREWLLWPSCGGLRCPAVFNSVLRCPAVFRPNYGTFVPAYFRSRERKFHRWNFRSLELSLPNIIYVLTCWNLASTVPTVILCTMDDSYHGLFVPFLDFSYRCENFSFFHILSTVSKVAIKVVGLRREHTARLLQRTNATDDHNDQAADDDDAAADDAHDVRRRRCSLPPTTPAMTTTTQMPYQHLQQYIR